MGLSEDEDVDWAEEPCSRCGDEDEIAYDQEGVPLCHSCFDEAWM